MRAKWYIDYFDVYPSGVCRNCGKECCLIFCDTKCEEGFAKKNNLPLIKKERAKLINEHNRVKKTESLFIRYDQLSRVDKMANRLSKLIRSVKW